MEDKNDYSIESLMNIFNKHAEKNLKNHQEMIEKWEKNYPDSLRPEHFDDFFNLSKALAVMVKDLSDLKHLVCNQNK